MSIVTRNFTIPAGGEIKIARQADFVRCLDATATITVQFDNGDTADLATGLSYSPEGGFRELTVLNGTANAVTVKLNLGKGQMADNRASVNTSQIMPTREGAPDVASTKVTNCIAGQFTQIAAANPLRRELMVFNNDATNEVYIGGDNFTYGIKVAPGGVGVFHTSAALYAGNNSAGNVTVRTLELEWSA